MENFQKFLETLALVFLPPRKTIKTHTPDIELKQKLGKKKIANTKINDNRFIIEMIF